MRIALITRRFDPAGGGTERDLLITARALRDAGREVAIYADEIRRPVDDLDVRKVRIGGGGRAMRLLSFARRSTAVARRDGADVVVSFARVLDADILRSGGGAHASYLEAARRWQTPAARLAMWVSPYHRAQTVIERRGFGSPRLRKAIAVSELVRADLRARFGLDNGRIATLYNGVDPARFNPQARVRWRDEVRRKLGLPAEARVIAFAGNGFARKGLEFLLRAFAAGGRSAYLVVAGADQSARRYQRLAARLNLADRVRFIGVSSSLEQVFAAADGFALPSLFEPFGNVIMEAMAAGLPTLCSALCGAAELLPDAMRELVVADPTDIAQLRAGLVKLLDAGRGPAEEARRAAERFTWDDHAAKLVKIIDSA